MRLILSAAAVRHHLIMTLHNLIITLLTIRSLLCATATYYVQALLLCATTLIITLLTICSLLCATATYYVLGAAAVRDDPHGACHARGARGGGGHPSGRHPA